MENRPVKAPVPINDFSSYPNASYAAKANTEQVKPRIKPKQEQVIASGRVKIKKRSAWRKAKHRIFEQEGKEIKDYVVNDVVIPAAKETLWTVVSNALEMLLYGSESVHATRRTRNLFGGQRYGNYVSYNSISNNRNNTSPVRSSLGSSTSVRNSVSLDDFIFPSRREALDFLARMRGVLNDYDYITVADVYNMFGVTSPSYTYNNFAWDKELLRDVDAYRTRDGYLLDLPDPKSFS